MNTDFTGFDVAELPDWHPDSLVYVEPDYQQPEGLIDEGDEPVKFPVSGGQDFKRAPAGTHLAVCNLVADVGWQPGSQMYPKPQHKIYVRFEIPAERVEYEKDGVKKEGPLTIGKFYTASMNEKANLRKDLEGWRGRAFTDEQAADFDVASILGKPCTLSVVESENNGKSYSNIASISAIPKGVPAPQAENPVIFYDPENDGSYSMLPEWLQKKISEQVKPPQRASQGNGSDDFRDDDIPF